MRGREVSGGGLSWNTDTVIAESREEVSGAEGSEGDRRSIGESSGDCKEITRNQ